MEKIDLCLKVGFNSVMEEDMSSKRSDHRRTRHFKPEIQFCCLVIISLLGLSCRPKVPSECSQLCGLSEEKQHSAFKSFPAGKQLDLYLSCENEKSCWRDSESPHDYYGQWMAEDKEALPILLERLRSERDEQVQQDIIYVLRFMAVNGHLRDEHGISEVVNRVVENMRGSGLSHVLGGDGGIERTKKWAKEIESAIN